MKFTFNILIFLLIKCTSVTPLRLRLTTARKATHGGTRRSKVSGVQPLVLPKNNSNSYYSSEPLMETHRFSNKTQYLPKQLMPPDQSPMKMEAENRTRGEKKGNAENAQKRVELRPKIVEQKGMSAIVVIGNRTHRVSGPVVKELLGELQKQNEDEEKVKKTTTDGTTGQSGGASALRRIYAANEVAEINRLLGKPLTDAKALGLIKNLLLDRVHTHLAKTMETNQIFDPSQPDLPSSTSSAAASSNNNNNNINAIGSSISKDSVHAVSPATQEQQGCHDQDPKEKCLYLKDLGLCNEFGSHPHIRRCSETCNLCGEPPPPPCQEDCSPTICSGCLAAKPAPLPPPKPILIEAPPPLPVITTSRPCPVTCVLPAPTVAAVVHQCPTSCIRRRTTPFPIVIRRTTPHPIVMLADNTPLPRLRAPSPSVQIHRVIAAHINCGEIVNVHRQTRPTLCPPLIHPSPRVSCEEIVNVHRLTRPTLCPPLIHSSPTVRAIIDSVTEMHEIHVPLRTTAHPSCGEIVSVHRQTRPTLCPPLMHLSPTAKAIIDVVTDMHEIEVPLRTTVVPVIHSTNAIHLIRRRTTILPIPHRRTTAIPLVPTGRLPLVGGGIGLNHVNVPGPLQLPHGKCTQAMDIGLAVDSSAAVVPHWTQMQNFLKSLVDRFQMNGISRIGLIQFDTIAKMPVHLDSYCDPAGLKEHIMKLLPDPYGRRRTDAALEMAKERLFSQSRSGIPKMLLVVEHGKINGGDPSINWSQLLAEPAQRLKDAGVNVLAVGTTPIATVDELKTITSAPDPTRVIPLQGYSQLQSIVPDIAKRACQIADTTATASPRIVRKDLDFSSQAPVPPIAIDSSSETPVSPIAKGCKVDYAKIGCYNDDQNNPRPLPDQLFNDRGPEYPGFSGKSIDWNNWEAYASDFVCRCAIETKKRGFKVFGIQFFASCWSGHNAEQTYMADGEGDPDLCISNNKDFKKCEATDDICIGKQETNFVYSLDAQAKRSHIPKGHFQ